MKKKNFKNYQEKGYYIKVNRCLARYSPRGSTTNQTTGHQMSRPICAEKAYFGPNLAVVGPKILIFMGVSKSFGTNITENHKDNLFASFFGQPLDQMGQKCRYLAQNASLGQIWPFLGPKSNFLGAGSKNFGTLVSGF